MSLAAERAADIKLIIFDVDGVLTDGGIYVGDHGEMYKPFNVKDGLAITTWHKLGLRSAIITGRQSEMVRIRAEKLGITDLWQGNPDKREAYEALKEKYSLSDKEIAYIGDDLIDLPIMTKVGLPIAVGDAVSEVKKYALLVTEQTGGHGAVREAIEFILKIQGIWDKIVNKYLE